MKCGERSEIFSHGGARKEADQLGMDFLGEVPLDISIRETSDSGHPIVVSQPDSEHAKTYVEIARKVKVSIDRAIAAKEASAPNIVMN